MPTKRTRVSHNQAPQISPVILSILSEGLFRMPGGADVEREAVRWKFFTQNDEKNRLFELIKGQILAEWIQKRPGSRPNFWWQSAAPEKCRRRLGGIGDAAHEHLNYLQSYDHGIPSIFVSRWDEDYYNGQARDIHGEPIGSEYQAGDFAGHAIDPDNPPRYESEAAYLKRHDLLTDDEKRRLRKKAFLPEILSADEDE